MKDKEETKQAAAPEVPNYDEMWSVSGYYLDNDGNDIRDRDQRKVKKVLDNRQELCYIILMTVKEKKKLDYVLFMQVVAGTRNVKPIARLIALAKDVVAIRDGEEPKESKELV